MNRRTLILLLAGLLLLLGLGGFYLFLSGGAQQAEDAKAPRVDGLIHVRTIYKAGDTNVMKPVGIGADANGNFWVTLRDNQKIIAFNRNGDTLRVWGARGLEPGQMLAPVGVDGDPASNHVYVTDRSRLRLLCYDLQGKFLWERPILNPLSPTVFDGGVLVSTFGPLALVSTQGEFQRQVGTRGPDKGQFDYPRATAPLNDGTFIVADTNNTRLQRVALKGDVTATVSWVLGQPPRYQDDTATVFGLPTGVTVDERGRAFVLDGFRHNIIVVDVKTGKETYRFKDLQGPQDGRFYLPTGIASLGNSYFAITDTYNDRVQIVRLLPPGDNNYFARNPWIWWVLAALPLLLLALLMGRRRVYATVELLDAARAEGDLRMLAAVYAKIHVLPEVFHKYEKVKEEGVSFGEYLVALDEPEPDMPEEGEEPTELTNEQRLIKAATPSRFGRLLLPRLRFLVADDVQAEPFKSEKKKTITLEGFLAQYSLESEGSPKAQVAETEDSAKFDDAD
ncbi:MAG: hypothetical protein CVT67_01600 [Actinobacteria bacterium HGW-Actinobacteria-7]|nr:MAG: hypothetical protein CVT67_01600 [Actinobacteria bacterium HGW-Actinobacteria-7]